MANNVQDTPIQARLPRGVNDRTPAEIAATLQIMDRIREVFELYGFEAVETPLIEYTDALGKSLPDQDRPNKGVFSFQDDDQQWLSLRYDLTAPLARYFAENREFLSDPYRSYRWGWVFRNEKPGPGRFWQFLQFDADTVGSSSLAADAECCMLAADTTEKLGVPIGSFVVKVWNRKVLDGIMDAVPELKGASKEKRDTVLRSIDKLDRLGIEGVQQLLGTGRRDASGDFTEGAQLSISAINFITSSIMLLPGGYSADKLIPSVEFERATQSSGSDFDFKKYRAVIRDNLRGHDFPAALEEGLCELEQLYAITAGSGYANRVKIDPSVVRGLDYYTGPVFEVHLTRTLFDEGRPVELGSLCGGGRYDGLVARFGGEAAPATGFSVGVSRIANALILLGKVSLNPQAGPVVVTVFDRERLADYQRIVKSLREAGIRAELFLGEGRLGAQLKYADKRRSPCVIIQGDDEKARGEVQIKDLIEGAKSAAEIASNEEWRVSRPAQVAVPEADLIPAVREILARYERSQ